MQDEQKHTPDQYKVNEIFTSVQGEGIYSGIPATFIRLQGCAVGCYWCDTKYTWAAGGKWMSAHEIVQQITEEHVVITGGEPTLWNLDELIETINDDSEEHFIQLETSGQNGLKGNLIPDWITCSPKPNLFFNVHKDLMPHVQELKFVLDGSLDPSKVIDLSADMYHAKIVIMPEGCPPTELRQRQALEWCLEYGWRYSDRLQYRLGVR